MHLPTLRSHFPHTEHTIYLNHAATGPLSQPVAQAVKAFLAQRHGALIENYFVFQHTIEGTRAQLARVLGTTIDRVGFSPNTSYALNVLACGLDWQPGDRIALPGCEFPTNVYPFMNLERLGVEIDLIPHQGGVVTLEAIEQALTPRTRLLSLSWVQFLSGFRTDLAAMGRLCKDRGVLFSVDAIQGLGAFEIPGGVEACGIDFLASGTHKWLLGVQGMGLLYLTEALQEQLTPVLAGWLHGPVDWDRFYDYKLNFHPDARRYELGTTNAMGIAALNAALSLYLNTGPTWCEHHILRLNRALADGLADLGLERYGTDDPAHASGIVTVHHPDPEGLYKYLDDHKIVVAVRNRMVRFAPTYYNTLNEIHQTLERVAAYKTGGA